MEAEQLSNTCRRQPHFLRHLFLRQAVLNAFLERVFRPNPKP